MGLLVPRGINQNLLSRFCPAPQFAFRLLLQHHVVGKELRKRDLGTGCDTDERDKGAEKSSHRIRLFLNL